MKYEKLVDALISLLQGNNYQYRMYKGDDGKRTSNPYDARYFYVSNPNMMFIIDESENTMTVHKSNIPFSVFKPLHKALRNLSRKYFVNLEIRDYNNAFAPKDFSPTLLKKKHKVDKIKNEAYHRVSQLRESYKRDNQVVDVINHSDSVDITHNGRKGITLPYHVDDLIPVMVEYSFKNDDIDDSFVIRLLEAYETYKEVRYASSVRDLNSHEQAIMKNYGKFFD